jgi:hypothetical protein
MPVGATGLAGTPTPVGLAGGPAPIPPVSPIPSVSPGAGLLPAAGAAGLIPAITPSAAGGSSRPPVGGLGRAPSVSGASAGGQIPQAGRTLTGAAPPSAAQMSPPTGAQPAAGSTAATTRTGRLFPPLLGAGLHGAAGQGHHGDPKPGDQESAHRDRPLQSIPGVPPALRGRAGNLADTPDFLTGSRPAEPASESVLDEDLWQADRPATPFPTRRR